MVAHASALALIDAAMSLLAQARAQIANAPLPQAPMIVHPQVRHDSPLAQRWEPGTKGLGPLVAGDYRAQNFHG